jgi:DNA-binding response OmpR family regulator
MRILIAEDDSISRRVLENALRKWGHEALLTRDGHTAFQALQGPDAPSLAILDWMMPGMSGLEVCRGVRAGAVGRSPYLILLTTKGTKEDIVAGLQAGADDYLTKPFNQDELQARLQVGLRTLALQKNLSDRVSELEEALSRVRQLQGLLTK